MSGHHYQAILTCQAQPRCHGIQKAGSSPERASGHSIGSRIPTSVISSHAGSAPDTYLFIKRPNPLTRCRDHSSSLIIGTTVTIGLIVTSFTDSPYTKNPASGTGQHSNSVPPSTWTEGAERAGSPGPRTSYLVIFSSTLAARNDWQLGKG